MLFAPFSARFIIPRTYPDVNTFFAFFQKFVILFPKSPFTTGGKVAIIIRAENEYASVVQWIERQIPVLNVGGSSPFGRAKRCTVIYRTSFSLLLQTPHPIGLHPWLALLGRDSKEQNVPPAPFAFFRLRACQKETTDFGRNLSFLFRLYTAFQRSAPRGIWHGVEIFEKQPYNIIKNERRKNHGYFN